MFYTTGPGVLTDAICKHLGMKSRKELFESYTPNSGIREFNDIAFDTRWNFDCVQHFSYGSQKDQWKSQSSSLNAKALKSQILYET